MKYPILLEGEARLRNVHSTERTFFKWENTVESVALIVPVAHTSSSATSRNKYKDIVRQIKILISFITCCRKHLWYFKKTYAKVTY
jgi:hypothetical protein